MQHVYSRLAIRRERREATTYSRRRPPNRQYDRSERPSKTARQSAANVIEYSATQRRWSPNKRGGWNRSSPSSKESGNKPDPAGPVPAFKGSILCDLQGF